MYPEFRATIYDKQIKAKTIGALLSQASKIANRCYNSYDVIIISYYEDSVKQPVSFKFCRRNKKTPWNTIEHGKWK